MFVLDLETKAFYCQWPSIVAQDGLLYRHWKSPGGQRDILQLLVPQSLWTRAYVLKLVCGLVVSGIFWVPKTLAPAEG